MYNIYPRRCVAISQFIAVKLEVASMALTKPVVAAFAPSQVESLPEQKKTGGVMQSTPMYRGYFLVLSQIPIKATLIAAVVAQ